MTLNENEEVRKEQFDGLVNCPHITNSFRRSKIAECIKRNSSVHFEQCEDCQPNDKFVEVTSDYVYDLSFWLCLFCGKNLCGRNMKQHAYLHYQREGASNSNSHALSLSVSQSCVWCYACDAYVDITNQREIKSIINVLEDHKTKSTSDPSSSSSSSAAAMLMHSNLNHFADLADFRQIRGLINLGNTCYMNSVLQCLSKTPYLKKVLEDLKENSYEFQINLNKLKPMKNFDQKAIIKGTLNPILDDVTIQLLETISELNYSRSGIRNCYDPHCLLRSIAQIVHQFGGYQQHDSHELMRHLLEIVRTGDIDRAKTAITRCLKTETHLDNKQLKGIAQQLISQLITTETVFKGFLVSTLQCEQCKHKTQREECFLDLSLPIYTYSVNKMDDGFSQNSGGIFNNYYHSNQNASHSQTQQHQHHHHHQQHYYHQQQSQNQQQGLSNHNSNIMADSSVKKSKKRTKKSEKRRNKENRNRATLSSSSSRIELDKTNIKIVSDENKFDKKLCVEGDDVSSTTQLGEEEMVSVDVTMNDNEAENCLQDELMHTNEEELDDDDDDDEEKSSSTNTDLCMEINSTSDDLTLNSQNKNSQDSYNANNDAMEVEFLDDTQRKCPISFENEECSVTTCLFRFTEAEVMGGNNKVGCEKCTKNNGKLIYQKTKKQLLISKPPPVLILHLKRFEAHMSSYRKTITTVNFSTILDLTPFCWKDCRTTAVGNQYLYSLYGVVEHSGTLRSGHYVAYVKVRPFYENLDFIQPLVTKSKSTDDLTIELLTQNVIFSSLSSPSSSSLPSNPNHTYNMDNSSSYWFRISDSSCTPCSEKEVLAAQAYLLFYERIA